MKPVCIVFTLVAAGFSMGAGRAIADGLPESAARGKAALEARGHLRGVWTHDGYAQIWRQWGSKTPPTDFHSAFTERYGLPAAPYPNGDLPMGLRSSEVPGRDKVILDCMICHGGSIFGRSMVGLPNTTLDLTLLFGELHKASKLPPFPNPLAVNRTRGVTNAGALGVFFISLRNSDLSRRTLPLALGWNKFPDLDAPAWWLLKKKSTMYFDGGMAADSTRSMMQFLLTPDRKPEELRAAESTWDDVRHYLLSIEAPKYPLRIDSALTKRGEALFADNCSRCHGTYGADWKYPNRIIPIAEIGTDRTRYDAITDAERKHYNSTWFGEKHRATKTAGFQAPPLDGIWATAPYFHNGSAPTVYDVLNSNARPTVFKRRTSTNVDAFDPLRLGWIVERLPAAPKATGEKLREVFDTNRFGCGNKGHTYGDRLSDAERFAIIEYLKTL